MSFNETSTGPRGTRKPDLSWPARPLAAAMPAHQERELPVPQARAGQQPRREAPPLIFGAPRGEQDVRAWLNQPTEPPGAARPEREDAAEQMQLCLRPAEHEHFRENRHAAARQPILARVTAFLVDPTARAEQIGITVVMASEIPNLLPHLRNAQRAAAAR